MSRIVCQATRAGAKDVTSSIGRSVGRRQTAAGRKRAKKTDKESGFESCPNSPRADATLDAGDQCQCGAQKELRHQTADCVSLDSFRFIKKLGSGGYGSVVLVEKNRGRDKGALYALKITNLNRAALVERDILPRLQSVPYTIDLAYAFFSASPPKAFLALPYAIGKDLFSLAGPGKRPGYLRKMFVLSYPHYVARIRIVLAELTAAIGALHKNRILYRDLKLENILVSGDGHVRLADFGLSRHFEPGESTMITGKTGTPDYMAPEVIRSSGAHGPATQYSFEADLWGLGVIAYELIVGQLPFKGRELADLEHSILHDPVELPHGYMEEKFSVLLSHERPLVLAALSFVKGLLQRQPNKRLTADQLPEHVLFRDLDWSAIESGHHDDTPFDIRRVVRELPPGEAHPRLPSAFSGIPSEKKERREKASNNAYENPNKYKSYHYCSRGEYAWYEEDLEAAARVDSGVVPIGAVVDDDDSQWDAQAGTPLHLLPGLIGFERAAAEAVTSLQPPPCSPDSACGDEEASLPPYPASPDYQHESASCEEGAMVPSDRLPSHPASPTGSMAEEDDSDDDVTIIGEVLAGETTLHVTPQAHSEVASVSAALKVAGGDSFVVDMFPRVRRTAKRLRSQRRLSFASSQQTEAARSALTLELASALSAALPSMSSPSAASSWPCWEAAPASVDGLPPKKRRRFLHPLSAAEPRVVVEPQLPLPLPPFSSLRHGAVERC